MSSLSRRVGFGLALALFAPLRAHAACPQLLMNNEFTEGFIGPWAIDVPMPATLMSAIITNDQYKTLDLSITNFTGGGATVTNELSQAIAIKYGERYRVSFYMYSSQQPNATARVAIRSAANPGKTYGLNDTFQVSSLFPNATQSFTFVAPEAEPEAVFSIYFPVESYAFYRFDSLFIENISAPECTGGSTGGASGTGGASSTGGAPGSGGAVGTGGAMGSGGAGTGGRGATGGVTASGGVTATGGRSTGGISGTGGRVDTGSGGAPSSGGTTATGGVSATGGEGAAGGAVSGTGGATGGDTDGGTPGTACVPGAQIACACPGTTSAHGIQVCNVQGTAYGSCTSCPDAGTSGAHNGKQGCGCALGGGDSPAAWAAAMVLLGLLRRNRPPRHRRAG